MTFMLKQSTMRKLKTLPSHASAEDRLQGGMGVAQDGGGGEEQEERR